ncbi:hypothetical protein HMI01_10880 [Halolactibacillus miurensis]|uniref:Uncharacterized protein n=1 Tax=Halolactibacillus miurensis TaxID=306541 RepID=A0A1I6SHD3_9BACI|nr:hypothetical protein [Halolactibacillus miurensis]GEM04100.1 hypothetical protein HMI01_10880 [Halolactibacillus miurensis]SFS76382.1 hypothetical protein SAMN05421668_10954 [Halolactibacillus miurensis]
MQAKVIKDFHDKETNNLYKKGQFYSHSDEGRVDSLIIKGFLGEKSKQPPKEDEYPKHLGGPYYELSNGEKVKGKQEAIEAQKAQKAVK